MKLQNDLVPGCNIIGESCLKLKRCRQKTNKQTKQKTSKKKKQQQQQQQTKQNN